MSSDGKGSCCSSSLSEEIRSIDEIELSDAPVKRRAEDGGLQLAEMGAYERSIRRHSRDEQTRRPGVIRGNDSTAGDHLARARRSRARRSSDLMARLSAKLGG